MCGSKYVATYSHIESKLIVFFKEMCQLKNARTSVNLDSAIVELSVTEVHISTYRHGSPHN